MISRDKTGHLLIWTAFLAVSIMLRTTNGGGPTADGGNAVTGKNTATESPTTTADTPSTDDQTPPFTAAIPPIVDATPVSSRIPPASAEPSILIKIDQIDQADSIQFVGPAKLDEIAITSEGTTLRLGHIHSNLAGKPPEPLAEITVDGTEVFWQWKGKLSKSATDLKIAAWLRFSAIRLMKGADRVATIQLFPSEEKTVVLKAAEPQKFGLKIDSGWVGITPPAPVPAAWNILRSTKTSSVLQHQDNAVVRFTVKFDPEARSLRADWQDAVQYAKTRRAYAEFPIGKLNAELEEIQRQKKEVERQLTLSYGTDGVSLQNQRRLQRQYQELTSREKQIPGDISRQTDLGAEWGKRLRSTSKYRALFGERLPTRKRRDSLQDKLRKGRAAGRTQGPKAMIGLFSQKEFER